MASDKRENKEKTALIGSFSFYIIYEVQNMKTATDLFEISKTATTTRKENEILQQKKNGLKDLKSIENSDEFISIVDKAQEQASKEKYKVRIPDIITRLPSGGISSFGTICAFSIQGRERADLFLNAFRYLGFIADLEKPLSAPRDSTASLFDLVLNWEHANDSE